MARRELFINANIKRLLKYSPKRVNALPSKSDLAAEEAVQRLPAHGGAVEDEEQRISAHGGAVEEEEVEDAHGGASIVAVMHMSGDEDEDDTSDYFVSTLEHLSYFRE
eukprot:254608_1